jgi:hypothetical protein
MPQRPPRQRLSSNAVAILSTRAGGGVSLTNRTASLVEINFTVAGLVASKCSTCRPSFPLHVPAVILNAVKNLEEAVRQQSSEPFRPYRTIQIR